MRAEWGNDEGTASATRHRAALVGWMEKTRAALDDFNPDFVLIWGDDQYENFREDIIPPYSIAAYENFTFSPPAGNVWGETRQEIRACRESHGGEDADNPADRGRIRHGLCL